MKILLIAPKCIPVNGAESIVNIKMLQSFAQSDDIEVDVVSRRNMLSTYPADSINRYKIKVRNLCIVESDNKVSIKTIWQTFMCFLKFGCAYKGSLWAYVALREVNHLIANNDYDFVLTKNSPSFLLGAYLKKKGFRWVASWNDPFPTSFYPRPYGQGNNHKPSLLDRLMIRLMKKADYHVFPTLRLQQHMAAYLPFPETRAKVIPHVVLTDTAPTWLGEAVREPKVM